MSTGRVLEGAYKGKKIYSYWSSDVYLETGLFTTMLFNTDTVKSCELIMEYEPECTGNILKRAMLGRWLFGSTGALLFMGIKNEDRGFIMDVEFSDGKRSIIQFPRDIYLKLYYEFEKIKERKTLNEVEVVSPAGELENKKSDIVESEANKQDVEQTNVKQTSKEKSFCERHFILMNILLSFILAALLVDMSRLPVIVRIIVLNALSFFCFYKDFNKRYKLKYKWIYWLVWSVWGMWLCFISMVIWRAT